MKDRKLCITISILAICAFGLVFMGCPPEEGDETTNYDMTGTYTFVKSGGNCTWIFTTDKKYECSGYGIIGTKTGTWSSKGNDVTISYTSAADGSISGNEVFTVQKNGNQLTLTIKDNSIQLSNLLVTFGLAARSVTLTKTGNGNNEKSTPTVADFTIGNLSQKMGGVTAVTITPKDNKSNGTITIYYDGSSTIPTQSGTYIVTFDVAATTNWKAAIGLSAGTLRIYTSNYEIINSITDLATFLANKSTNTASSPYYIALNVKDISNIRTTLNSASNKYIFLDLSGSTITTIPNSAFYNSYSLTGCTTLTEITISDSVTGIGNLAFCSCDNLASVTIPNSVTSIGDYAFTYCTNLTSITIGSGITSIAEGTFSNCISLTDVNIPNSVTSIGDIAFSNCTSLTSITIPNSVTNIGDCAFSLCGSLTSITIPDSVTIIGDSAFSDTNLTEINVNTSNNNYSSENGVLYNKNKTILIAYPMGKTASFFIIPDSITSIGDNAFYKCTNLTSITIPNSVTSIGDYAFYKCTNLTSIIIPNSVTSIGDYAFSICTNLASVIISNSITNIRRGTFSYCRNLTSVTIPDSITSIGDETFYECTSLTNVTFRSSIPSSGFSGNTNYPVFQGDLRNKFYASNSTSGTPGTYTTTAPVNDYSVWNKEP